jgi:hypothetical protein
VLLLRQGCWLSMWCTERLGASIYSMHVILVAPCTKMFCAHVRRTGSQGYAVQVGLPVVTRTTPCILSRGSCNMLP